MTVRKGRKEGRKEGENEGGAIKVHFELVAERRRRFLSEMISGRSFPPSDCSTLGRRFQSFVTTSLSFLFLGNAAGGAEFAGQHN